MKRLEALLLRLGVPGVAGAGVLLFCLSFGIGALLPVERELAARGAALERNRAQSPLHAVATTDRGESLQRFYALFPEVAALPDEMERIYAIGRSARLELDQGEYRLERRGEGLAAYRVVLPVRGSYSQIRRFVGDLLKDVPAASLDGLRFERKKVGESRLEAQLRLTVYFGPGSASERTSR